MAQRSSTAHWDGSLKEGGGTVALGSGAWEGPYTFKSRFEEGDGTNPEELIAAAHAGCYSMFLSGALGEAGHEPESIDTEARVHLRVSDAGPEIHRIDLVTRGRVPGIDAEEFSKQAQASKEKCPVSKALAAVSEITIDAQLEG
ncbi:MAG: OsmC family protein [Actinomycetota bacterium]|nr:OsmC family protein [Actinomycetota bacterium]